MLLSEKGKTVSKGKRLCVFVHVCLCVCMHVHVYKCVLECVHVHKHVHLCVLCACVYMGMYLHMHNRLQDPQEKGVMGGDKLLLRSHSFVSCLKLYLQDKS